MSTLGALVALGAIGAAQGCSGSKFCGANSYECGTPSGATAGTAGTAGSSGGGSGGTGGSGSSGGGSGGTGGGGMGGLSGTSGEGGMGGAEGGNAGVTGMSGGGGEAGGGGPPTCDPDALAAGCVPDDANGIFVAPTGDDQNAGSSDSPLASLGEAITRATAGLPIFVCGGTFDEHVDVTSDDVALHGGFACPSGGAPWVYDAAHRATIAPSDPGYALRVNGATNVTVTDLAFVSADADTPGQSSVAVFVSGSQGVTFSRVAITAGDGMNGESAGVPGSNHHVGSLDGNPATGIVGGEALPAPALTASHSVRGAGGDGGDCPRGLAGAAAGAGSCWWRAERS